MTTAEKFRERIEKVVEAFEPVFQHIEGVTDQTDYIVAYRATALSTLCRNMMYEFLYEFEEEEREEATWLHANIDHLSFIHEVLVSEFLDLKDRDEKDPVRCGRLPRITSALKFFDYYFNGLGIDFSAEKPVETE
jgi:hypothetical protein